jgi:hypothetical protein
MLHGWQYGRDMEFALSNAEQGMCLVALRIVGNLHLIGEVVREESIIALSSKCQCNL